MNAGESREGHAPPYSARVLSLKEVTKGDVYTFISPKNQLRRVRVVSVANLILALQLEFDPDVLSYVERPRLLTCDTQTYEFSFWYRERSGREYLPLVVPNDSSEPAPSGRRRHRKAAKLLDAAERARLPLKFVLETDLITLATEFSAWLRMLPSVQLSCRFSHRYELRNRILAFAGRFDRVRVDQIVEALEGFPPADVRCIVCDLIHAGMVLVDSKAPFNQATVCQVKRS